MPTVRIEYDDGDVMVMGGSQAEQWLEWLAENEPEWLSLYWGCIIPRVNNRKDADKPMSDDRNYADPI